MTSMTPGQREELVAQLALVGIHGCGDSSCIILPPQGLATNGGCQCVSSSRTGLEAKRLAIGLAYVLRNYARNSTPAVPVRDRVAQVLPTVFAGLGATLADKVDALIACAVQGIRERRTSDAAEQLRALVRRTIEAAEAPKTAEAREPH